MGFVARVGFAQISAVFDGKGLAHMGLAKLATMFSISLLAPLGIVEEWPLIVATVPLV